MRAEKVRGAGEGLREGTDISKDERWQERFWGEKLGKQRRSHKQESWQQETVWILNELSGQRRGKIIELLPVNDKDGSGALWERRHPVYLAAIALGRSWTGTQWQLMLLSLWHISKMRETRISGKVSNLGRELEKQEAPEKSAKAEEEKKSPWACAELLMKCLMMSGERISSCHLSRLRKAPQDWRVAETIPTTKADTMQKAVAALLVCSLAEHRETWVESYSKMGGVGGKGGKKRTPAYPPNLPVKVFLRRASLKLRYWV